MNETVKIMIGCYLIAMLVIDSLYLVKYHNGIWMIFVIVGAFFAVNLFYESSRTQSLSDISLGIFVGILYSIGFIIVLLSSIIRSIHHIIVQYRAGSFIFKDNVFHFFPAFMLLLLVLLVWSFFLFKPHFSKLTFFEK